MSFEAARCSHCGGDLRIFSDEDFVTCRYCQSSVKVRDTLRVKHTEHVYHHHVNHVPAPPEAPRRPQEGQSLLASLITLGALGVGWWCILSALV